MNFDRFSEERNRILDGIDWDEVTRLADDYADWLKSRDEDNKTSPMPDTSPNPFEKRVTHWPPSTD